MDLNGKQHIGQAYLSDLMYLPPIEFFVAVSDLNCLTFDPSAPFRKQTYRNRARILLANKVDTLSVPVLFGRKQMPYREMRIDYSQKWKNIHLRGIQSGYGKAPFFEFYFPYLQAVFDKNLTFLWDLNWELLTVCLRLVGLQISLQELEKAEESVLIDGLSGICDPRADFSTRSFMTATPYAQMFGRDFEPNLSVLDLLFCKGPESKVVLNLSKKINEQSLF
jgi:hypothetical protein